MSFEHLTLLWSRYEAMDRLAAEAERVGDEVTLRQTRDVLAFCADLIARAEQDQMAVSLRLLS